MKKFLAGPADLFAYDASDNLLFSSRTMIDDSIDISTSAQDVRAGQGNILQFKYFHTSEFKVTANESQWNMDFIAANIGADKVTGANVWFEEDILLSSGAGTVTNTPINTASGNAYMWVTDSTGLTTRVSFSGKTFTYGSTSQTVSARYLMTNAAATQVTVSGNIIPSVVRLVLHGQLFSSSGGSVGSSTKIGSAIIEVPQAQLTGAQKISLTSTGVSQTPLEMSALADSSNNYATITENITNANWYDNVYALAFTDDTITLATGTTTLAVYAVPTTGSAFLAPVADLTFSSATTAAFTVGAHTGVVTYAGAGSSVISVSITSKTSVTAQCTVSST